MIWRIQSRSVFTELRTQGQRVRSGSVRVTFCPQDVPHPLVAFAFGRKFGNAVERNRARRRLRAAFSEAWDAEPGPTGAFLLSGSRSVLTADFHQLVTAVADCFSTLSARTSPLPANRSAAVAGGR